MAGLPTCRVHGSASARKEGLRWVYVAEVERRAWRRVEAMQALNELRRVYLASLSGEDYVDYLMGRSSGDVAEGDRSALVRFMRGTPNPRGRKANQERAGDQQPTYPGEISQGCATHHPKAVRDASAANPWFGSHLASSSRLGPPHGEALAELSARVNVEL